MLYYVVEDHLESRDILQNKIRVDSRNNSEASFPLARAYSEDVSQQIP